jgi:hypothetical protein
MRMVFNCYKIPIEMINVVYLAAEDVLLVVKCSSEQLANRHPTFVLEGEKH